MIEFLVKSYKIKKIILKNIYPKDFLIQIIKELIIFDGSLTDFSNMDNE